MKFKKTITQLALIAFSGQLLGGVLRYSIDIVISRTLGASAFGVFSFGLVILTIGGVIANVGLESGVQKFIPIYRSEENERYVRGTVLLSLSISFVGGIILALSLFFGWEYVEALTEAELQNEARFIVLGLPFIGMMRLGAAATRSFNETKYSEYILDIGQPICAIILVAGGLYLKTDISAVIIGYVVSLLIGAILAGYYLFALDGLALSTNYEFETQRILVYSMPLVISTIATRLLTSVDVIMLGIFESSTTVGIYQAAFRISLMLSLLLAASKSVFPPLASEYYYNGQHGMLEDTYSVITKWIFILSSLGYIFMFIFSHQLLRVFGEEFIAGSTVLLILGAAQLVNASTGPAGFVLLMSEHDRLEISNVVFFTLMNIVLNYIFVQYYGAIGVAIGTGTAIALLNITRVIEIWWIMRISPLSKGYMNGIVGIVVVTVFMSIADRVVQATLAEAILIGCVSLVLFTGIIWLLGLEKKDKILFQELNN